MELYWWNSILVYQSHSPNKVFFVFSLTGCYGLNINLSIKIIALWVNDERDVAKDILFFLFL